MCLTGRKTQNAGSVDTAARHSLCTKGNDGLINSAKLEQRAKKCIELRGEFVE